MSRKNHRFVGGNSRFHIIRRLLPTHKWLDIFLDEINPVKHCKLEIGCHYYDDILFRVNVDHIAAVSYGSMDVLFPVDDPPQIPIVHTPEVVTRYSSGSRHFFNPACRYDLLATRNAFIQAQQSDLCHIFCRHT